MSNLALRYLPSDPRLYTQAGEKHRDKISLENCSNICGLYGPYVNLPRGDYYASIRFSAANALRGTTRLDVCCDANAQIITSSAAFDLAKSAKGTNETGILFHLNQTTPSCQVRLHCLADVSATIEGLEIEFRHVDPASIENTVQDGLADGASLRPPLVRLSRARRIKRFLQHPFANTLHRLETGLIDRLASIAAERTTQIRSRDPRYRFIKNSGETSGPYQVWLPAPAVLGGRDGPYMQSANCQARDFYHRDFAALCHAIGVPVGLHRKLWEFAFIWHHLRAEGAIRQGARGVGFGVGKEPLPSLFAKHGCVVLATDAPPDIGATGWTATGQHSSSLEELGYSSIVLPEIFKENVKFSFCDMNAIDPSISDFDFCWSSCSFEHLGSIEKGLDFVVNSVENTLKVGGVACHTSELNLSSNDRTLETGATVLFRRRDLEHLIRRLEDRGHRVKALPLEPGDSFIDFLIDVPPYNHDPHLRLKIAEFVSTSFGIVVTRGG